MRVRILLSGVLGNALEFYDFMLYGVFASIIASEFFPSSDPFISLIASWGAFAAGFLMRPIGALLFGHIGDKLGRKQALSLTIICMGVPTFLIGCLPGYQYIGLWAPLFLITCRLAQGLFTGGEFNGAAIFTLEHLKTRPGFAAGFITASCVIGSLSATLIGKFLLHEDMPSYAWRYAFLFGGFVSLIGYYVRTKISETPTFKMLEVNDKIIKKSPIYDVMRNYKKPLVLVISFSALNGALIYTLFGFMNVYLNRYLGIPLAEALFYNIFGLFAYMISAPLMGIIYDRMQAQKYYLSALLLVIVSAMPVFILIQLLNAVSICAAQILLGVLTGLMTGPQHAYMQEMFPAQNRYTGVAFGYSVGMAVGGGTAPMVITSLIQLTDNLYMPVIYIIAMTSIFLASMLFLNGKIEKSEKPLTSYL